ncbi:MAG: DNA gyrase inhibitor YacG [Steroidobacteraceae bacterium]
MKHTPCPTCQRLIEYSLENKWRPFCSERCKLIDLGEWAAEKHVISIQSDVESAELGEPDTRDN